MYKMMLGAFGAATIAFSTPVAAQDLPLESGLYWDVGAISIDDGHFGDYADFLASEWRKRQEFAKSKGWIKGYHILGNNNPRDGEPDLYLVTILDHVPTPAEDKAREKEMNAFMAQTTRASIAGSGARAKYRKQRGDMLLQELVFNK
jgi:hypothetical protein